MQHSPFNVWLSRRWPTMLSYVILGIGATIILFPLTWAALSAFKSNRDIFIVPLQMLPQEWHFENFVIPFQQRPFLLYFANSLFAALSSVILTLVIASLAGYSLAKYQYFGKPLAFLAILSTMMLPVQVLLVPLYLIVRDLKWLETYQGLIIPQAVNAFSIFLMRQHIMGIPDDYIDAARLDGSSEVGILWRVILPMSRPTMAAVVIFSFLGSWDSFIWPLVAVTGDSLRTLPLGLSFFFSEYGSNVSVALAAAVIIALPMLILFITLQRHFVEGLTRSGLK